jgi:hypothetical protein
VFLGNKARQERKADNLTAICEPTVYKMWDIRSLTTLAYLQGLQGYKFNNTSIKVTK